METPHEMGKQMKLEKQARELELYTLSSERYHPQILTIEKITAKRLRKAGEGPAREYATAAIEELLQITARHYTQEVHTPDGFQFDYVARTVAAGKIAADIVEELNHEYKEWISKMLA